MLHLFFSHQRLDHESSPVTDSRKPYLQSNMANKSRNIPSLTFLSVSVDPSLLNPCMTAESCWITLKACRINKALPFSPAPCGDPVSFHQTKTVASFHLNSNMRLHFKIKHTSAVFLWERCLHRCKECGGSSLMWSVFQEKVSMGTNLDLTSLLWVRRRGWPSVKTSLSEDNWGHGRSDTIEHVTCGKWEGFQLLRLDDKWGTDSELIRTWVCAYVKSRICATF